MGRRLAAALIAAAAAELLASPAAAQTTCSSHSLQRACGARGVSHDSVLLQRAGVTTHRADAGGMQSSRHACETCADVFHDLGGCAALHGNDDARLAELRHTPELAGCETLGCEEQIGARCAPAEHHAPACEMCAFVFGTYGGCEALRSDDKEWFVKFENTAFAGCGSQDCRALIQQRCDAPPPSLGPSGAPSCAVCAHVFGAAGGCEARANGDASALERFLETPAFAGCGSQDCRMPIEERCARTLAQPGRAEQPGASAAVVDGGGQLEACEACAEAFSGAGGCSWVRNPTREDLPPLPEACSDMGPRCVEHVSARCHGSDATSCGTAQEGDACFEHVRWAMTTGVVEHPEWYPALSQRSSFEEFQMLLHLAGPHGCPAPCPALELPCHTASHGEACHEHVLWAQTQGLAAHPELYPAALTSASDFEDVQAWLHQIHHGDCLQPCPSTASGNSSDV